MKKNYSYIFRQHCRKKPYTYIRSKQGRSDKGLGNKKLSGYVQGSISKKNIFDAQLTVYSTRKIYFTEVSLEAFRVSLTRSLNKKYVRANWCYQICTHTHIILRKHKQPRGGTVDRISMGMRRAFGKPYGRAASVKDPNTRILILNYNSNICKHTVVKETLRGCLKKLSSVNIIKRTK